MKIQVTEKDIKNGVRNDPRMCPVALAVKRILRQPFVTVNHYHITVGHMEGYAYRSPGEVQHFIKKFDKCWWPRVFLKPFEFELRD